MTSKVDLQAPRQKKRRRKRSRYPYTRKEKTVVLLACVQISFALWAMALTSLWSQVVFTSLSLVGLAWVLLPQFYAHKSEIDPRHDTIPSFNRLLRYPVFWSGLLFIFYILLQFSNPGYAYEQNVEHWRAFEIDHQKWLPSSVDSPISQINSIRVALIFAGVFLMQCYLKVGIARRISFLRILWWIVFNFIAIVVLSIAQKRTGAEGIFWYFEVIPNFLGPIPYTNRAAAILIQGMVLSMALYFLHLKSLRMELKHSGPHLVVLLVILFVFGLLWSTQSQGGVIIASFLLVAFVLLTLIPSLKDGSTIVHKVLLFLAMLLMSIAAFFYTFHMPDREQTVEKLGNIREEIQQVDSDARRIATHITLEMVKQKPIYGWGAGSWRYVFAYFQLDHPEIQYLDESKTTPAVWHDAHNDWVQFLSEFGVVGCTLLIFTLTWPLIESLVVVRSFHLTQVILNLGLIGLLTYAWIDLLLQNQAVLCLFCFTGFLVNRLNIEQLRGK